MARRSAPAASSGIADRRASARSEATTTYQERRAEILLAAARVFKAKGLAGCSVGDIAAEAGVDRASLYYYVGSKEELFHEVVREAVAANLRWARRYRDADLPAPRKLRDMMTSLMASYGDNYPILYVFVQENLSRMPKAYATWSDEMRASNREFEKIFVQVVADGMRDGTLREVGPPRLVAYGLLGMFGWTYRWFNPETDGASAAEIASTFADTVLLGLEKKSTARR